MRTGLGLVFVAVAGLLALAGAVLLLWASYIGLSSEIGVVGASMLLGGLAWLLAGIALWIALRLTR